MSATRLGVVRKWALCLFALGCLMSPARASAVEVDDDVVIRSNLTVVGTITGNVTLTAGSFAGDGERLTNLVSGSIKASLYGPKTDSTLRTLASTTNQIELLIDGGSWTVSSDLCLGTNVAIRFTPGTVLTLASNVWLKIYGPINCGSQQIVDGDVGGFDWLYCGRPKCIPVEWLGVRAEVRSGHSFGTAGMIVPIHHDWAAENTRRINSYYGHRYNRGLQFGVGWYFISDTIHMPDATLNGVSPHGLLSHDDDRTIIIATDDFPLDDPMHPLVGSDLQSFTNGKGRVSNAMLIGNDRAHSGVVLTAAQENDGVENVYIGRCMSMGILTMGQNYTIRTASISPSTNSTHFIGIGIRSPGSRETIRDVTIVAPAAVPILCTTLTELSNSIATATGCYGYSCHADDFGYPCSTVFPANRFYGIVISGPLGGSVSIEDYHTEALDCGILNISESPLLVKNFTASSSFCDLYQDYPPVNEQCAPGGLTVLAMSSYYWVFNPARASYAIVDRISGYQREKNAVTNYGGESISIPFYASDVRTRRYNAVDSADLSTLALRGAINTASDTNDSATLRVQPRTSFSIGNHRVNAGVQVEPADIPGQDIRLRTFGLYIPHLSASAYGYLVGDQNGDDSGQIAGVRIDSISATQAESWVSCPGWKNYGIWIRSLSGGHGTWSQYGLKIDDVSGSEVDDWGVYIAGGEKNYFATNVGIGTTNVSAMLTVQGTAVVSYLVISSNAQVSGALSAKSLSGDGAAVTNLGSESLNAGSVGSVQLTAGAVTTNKLGADVDARYVNVTGDTMWGNLVMGGTSLVFTNGISGKRAILDASGSGLAYFRFVGGNGSTSILNVASNYFGMGQITPSEMLHVNGNAIVTGAVTAVKIVANGSVDSASDSNDVAVVTACPRSAVMYESHRENSAFRVQNTAVNGQDVRMRTFGLYIPQLSAGARGVLVGDQNGEDSGQIAGIRIDSISATQAEYWVNDPGWKNYGIWIRSLSGGHGTWSQYGLKIDDVSGSEYEDYGVFIAGGDKNYFATNVGIGTSNPVSTLDVNGSFRVSGGTAFGRLQAGTLSVGTNSTGYGVYTTAFPVVFASSPAVVCTPRLTASGSNEMFMTTIRAVTVSNFVLGVRRGDTNSAWRVPVSVSWFAWE